MMTNFASACWKSSSVATHSAGTIRLYPLHVAAFAQHFHRSPDQLGDDDIRRY